MKLYVKKIDNCISCPNCDTDMNITRYECNKKNGKFIAWDRGQHFIKIPEWCPLPDCDLMNKKDFEIE